MTRIIWVEYICDYCDTAEHFIYGDSDKAAKKMGWVIKNKKYFCSEECFRKYKKEVENERHTKNRNNIKRIKS